MSIRVISLSLVLYTFSNFSFGQSVIGSVKLYNKKQIASAADAESALYADKARKIRLLSSPDGPGKKIEVASSKAKDLYFFEKEHNVVWVKFRALMTSGLAFTIVPDSTKDDYDFLLFKAEGRNTVSKIQNRELLPIRSNIARTKNVNFGYTGLRLNEKSTHYTSGLNAGFSKTIDVVDGEVYYLAIDNVYDNGGGATIEFMYFDEQVIEGTVVNSKKEPVQAEVVWENAKSGTELTTARSNPADGKFKITVPYEKDRTDQYTLSIFSEGYLFEEITYSPVELETKSSEKLKVILPKLKKGAKAQLSSINFVGNKSLFIKSAFPSLRRLVKLMKRNKDLKVLIVGHTNGCGQSVAVTQILSESRAMSTRDYLVKKGIDKTRIETEGRNCSEMLYPVTSSEARQELNRRIEVEVTSY